MIKFSTRMQGCHNKFQGGHLFSRVHVNGYTPSIILDGYGIVGMNSDLYVGTKSGQCLIYTVVNDLPDKMV